MARRQRGPTVKTAFVPEGADAAVYLFARTDHAEGVAPVAARHGGTVVLGTSDGVGAAFASAGAAVDAAIELQQIDAARIGVDVDLERAARVAAVANDAQILLAEVVCARLRAEGPHAARLVDVGTHALRGVIEGVALVRAEHGSFDSDRRPPRTGQQPTTNLPARPRALVGREADIASLSAELGAGVVVTLTGVGGVGKTELAVAVGHRHRAAWRDGVWFVALDVVDRSDGVTRTLLGTLGIEGSSSGDVSALLDGLRHREMVLILDNCEHVLDAAANLAQAITDQCPRVCVLATSREPLGVVAERVRRVRSLDTGPGGHAVELFRQRAHDAGAVLEPSQDDDAILQICRRLDGIPLAIELAAARARSLRAVDIAERLDDMLRVLTGDRGAARTDRHRTMRAAIQWSHELLEDDERAALARLSIFAGTFSLDAATAIIGVDDALDVVDRLVARSLVVIDDAAEQTRFRVLEPVRQFAAEQLDSSGETASVRDRHTTWYLALAEELGARWRAGEDQATWPIAARDLPNLVAAFDGLVEHGRIDDAQRFAVATFGVIDCQFDNIVDSVWAPAAVEIDSDHVGPHTASACGIAAWGMSAHAKFEESARWLRRGLAALERGSHDDGILTAATVFHSWSSDERVAPDGFLERSLEDALASDDLHRQIWVLSYAGCAEETLERAQRLGNQTLIALAYSGLVGEDDTSRLLAAERFWEAAQRSHSYIFLSHAAHRLGVEQIRSGAAVDGLLVLRSPLHAWLLRADRRVWDVLHSAAWGLAAAGDVASAARLVGAIGGRSRPLHGEHRPLERLLEDGLDVVDRARLEASGSLLDAGDAVAEALDRIDSIARSRGDVHDVDVLTGRQREIASLVARGLTNKQIAERLGISRYTAETHVRNILERLGAATRAEVAARVTRASSESGTPPRT